MFVWTAKMLFDVNKTVYYCIAKLFFDQQKLAWHELPAIMLFLLFF